MFLHADLVCMGATMLVMLIAKGMIHRSHLAAFMESERQRQEIISEKVLRCKAEFKNEPLQPLNCDSRTTSDVETESDAISKKYETRSIASAPAQFMRAEYSFAEFLEDALFKECTGDCLRCDAVVWVEGETSPVLLENLRPGEKVLCYDTLAHTPKFVPLQNISQSAGDNKDQWVIVTLEDQTF